MPIKLECAHADTCLPCYWGGHQLAHIQIPVRPGMMLGEIQTELHNELRDGCFGGSDDRALEDHPKFQEFCDAAEKAIDAMVPNDPKATTFFNDLEPQEEDDESVYAYFVFLDLED